MKKIALAVLGFLFYSVLSMHAQAPAPIIPSYNVLKKQYEKSNLDIEHEKKGIVANTWIKRATILQNVNDGNLMGLANGAAEAEIKLKMGEPSQKKEETKKNVPTVVYVYDRIDLYLQNGVLNGWNEKENIVEKPLEVAIEAINKAFELDATDKINSKQVAKIDRLKKQLKDKATNAYSNEDYEESARLFALAGELHTIINEYDKVYDTPTADSLSMYYAGVVYIDKLKNNEKAMEYFQKCADLKYELKDSYTRMIIAVSAMKDTLKMREVLGSAIENVPTEVNFVLRMIDLEMASGNPENAIEYIEKAKQAQPDNMMLYYAQGSLYEGLKKYDEAEKVYNASVAKDPNFGLGHYGKGVLAYYKAKDALDAAADITDNDEYEKAKAAAMELLKASLPHFEKASEIFEKDPKSVDSLKNTLEYLKTIYIRVNMTEKSEEAKAKLEAIE